MISFFFKQKTAYEMRISDWSSDVCSSDLHNGADLAHEGSLHGLAFFRAMAGDTALLHKKFLAQFGVSFDLGHGQHNVFDGRLANLPLFIADLFQIYLRRSEEHTSELQSLMRISYAVFFLKKKNIKNTTQI